MRKWLLALLSVVLVAGGAVALIYFKPWDRYKPEDLPQQRGNSAGNIINVAA